MSDFSGYKLVLTDTLEAGEDLTAYRAVKVSSGKLYHTDTQGEKADGIVLEDYDSGEAAMYVILGEVPVAIKTAANVAHGDLLTPSDEGASDAGKLEEAASSDYVLARVKEAPSADDDVVVVFVNAVSLAPAVA